MSSSPRPRIFIVEDESKVALKYQRVLEEIGDSKIAEDSTQFFEQINDYEPQVILLDLVLEGDREYDPWEAGIRILERLREKRSRWRDIPVVVVTGIVETGRQDPDIEGRCRELGVSEFHRKPIHNEELRQAVKNGLQAYEQADQS
jgi:CheY-like chemotaxis protein